MAAKKLKPKWELTPIASYSVHVGDPKREFSIGIRPIAARPNEFVPIVVKGSMAKHSHATLASSPTLEAAMAQAERVVGPDGRWFFGSGMGRTETTKDGLIVAVMIYTEAGEIQLHALVSPMSSKRKRKTVRAVMNGVLAHHAHHFETHKTLKAALRAAPAAARKVTRAARCECKTIRKTK